jgi:predicted transposase YdaD
MGGYDAAVKVILDRCRDTALSYFLGLSVEESEIMELPQETVTVRRADFPLRVVTSDKKERIVVLEVQTRWSWDVPLRLLEYEVRYRRRYRLAAMGAVLLLTPSERCVDHFRDGGIDYRFILVRLWELDASEAVGTGLPCLMPFVPLMKDGLNLAEEAERRISESDLNRQAKGDLLTGMTILSGLVSEEIPQLILRRRRDIMMESAGYEIIKKEGFDEGLQAGIEQGIEQGKVQEAQEAVLDNLEARFGAVPMDLVRRIYGTSDLQRLKELRRQSATVPTLEAFVQLVEEKPRGRRRKR